MSMNPYADQTQAVRDFDDALRRAASLIPRDDPYAQVLFNCVRILGRAVTAQERLTSYRTTGEC